MMDYNYIEAYKFKPQIIIKKQPVETMTSKDPQPLKELDEILLNLKIIASIKEYDKLTIDPTTNNISIDKPFILQGIVRYLYGYGRENTISTLEDLYSKIDKLADTLITMKANGQCKLDSSGGGEDMKNLCQNIIMHLTLSITGLQNLRITYLSDIPIASRIQLIIEKIANKTQKLNNLLKMS